MRIERVGVKFPALGFEPRLQLADRWLDGSFAGEAAGGDTGLEYHEVATFDIARGDEVVNRNSSVQVETQAGSVLSAAIGLLELHDHSAPGSHGTAVARED